MLLHDFTLYGGPGMSVAFFQPPGRPGRPGGAHGHSGRCSPGTSYILAPDRQSVAKLFTSSDYEFADLDRDGVYELIAWNRRPFDLRCMFGIFAVRFYPEVFVRAWRCPSKGLAAFGLAVSGRRIGKSLPEP